LNKDISSGGTIAQAENFLLTNSEIIRIHSSEIQPPPSMVLSGGIGQEFITGVFSHAERLLIIMDIDRMFSDEERGHFELLLE
jgi:purine-binding chemotaxis protein CheW